MMPAILVFDLGLSKCKAVVIAGDGEVLAKETAAYPTHHPAAGHAEQNPADWWDAVCGAARALFTAQPELADGIDAISVTGHMHALVALDEAHQPLTPAIILGDQRAHGSAQQIVRDIGLDTIYRVTGARMESAMPAAKMRWLRDHAPDLFRRVSLFTGCKDYVRGLLTGDRLTDPIDACALSLYDLGSGGWSGDLLRAVGVSAGQLPDIAPCVALAGALQPDAAASLGLRAGIRVVVGAGDDVEVLGAGLMKPGKSEEHIGTTGSFLTCTTEPLYDPAMALEVYPHAQPGLWVSGGSITAAGSALDWAAHILGYSDFNAVFTTLPDKTDAPLIFIPHLSGERSPHWNPRTRGVWLGLSAEHTRSHLMRAALLGVAFALKAILTRIDVLLGQPGEVVGVHHPADSIDWLHLRANVYGRPLGVLHTTDPTALGAMILGAAGIGLYASLDDAVQQVTRLREVAEPDAQRESLADEARLYDQLQNALTPVWETLAASSG